MIYLNPSVQRQIGRTCSDARYARIMRILMVLVPNHFNRQERETFVESSSGNFMIFQPRARAATFTATEQIEYDHRIRAQRSPPLRFWSRYPVEFINKSTNQWINLSMHQ
jgi:hypothetical protein